MLRVLKSKANITGELLQLLIKIYFQFRSQKPASEQWHIYDMTRPGTDPTQVKPTIWFDQHTQCNQIQIQISVLREQ